MVAGIRMALLAGGLALFLSRGQAQPPPVYSDKALEEFPVLQDGGPLLVPVTIQGKTYSFLLDTGASCTAYDKALSPLLGAPTGRGRVLLSTGVEVVYQFAAPDASVGKLPLPKGQTVYATDLSKVRAVGGLDVRGVLGMDFLRDYVVELDHGRGRRCPSSLPAQRSRIRQNAGNVTRILANAATSEWRPTYETVI